MCKTVWCRFIGKGSISTRKTEIRLKITNIKLELITTFSEKGDSKIIQRGMELLQSQKGWSSHHPHFRHLRALACTMSPNLSYTGLSPSRLIHHKNDPRSSIFQQLEIPQLDVFRQLPRTLANLQLMDDLLKNPWRVCDTYFRMKLG